MSEFCLFHQSLIQRDNLRANLSRDYFTNRQDRYIAIQGHAPLAEYFLELIRRFASVSYRLRGYSNSSGPNALNISWQDSSPMHVEPTVDSQAFTAQVKASLDEFCSKYARSSPASLACPRYPVSDSSGFDTILQPFLQMGPFGIMQETQNVVPTLLDEAGKDANIHLDWTSGYFSVRKPYREGLLNSNGSLRIVCASPQVGVRRSSKLSLSRANKSDRRTGFISLLASLNTYLQPIPISNICFGRK